MSDTKRTILKMAALLLICGSAVPAAAEDTTVPAAELDASKAPITVEADKLTFNDMTGDVFASGNVSFQQRDSKVFTELLTGNTKKTRVWVNGQATLLQPGVKLNGTKLDYDYVKKEGTLETVDGSVNKNPPDEPEVPLYIKGKKANFAPRDMVLNDADVTACPAKETPCYHVEADKVELWPGQKMVAYNAKFYIRNFHLYTLGKYEKDFTEQDGTSTPFPSLDYSSSDGLMISQEFKYKFTDKLKAYVDFRYFTKAGYKPIYGILDSEKSYSIRLEQADFENGDDEWVKKAPELTVTLTPRYIAPNIKLKLFATVGRWQQDNINDLRREVGIYFARDPLALSDKWKLTLGTGYNVIHYNYDDSNNKVWHLDAVLDGKINDRLDVWTKYFYSDESGTSPYLYDRITNTRELDTGFMYKVDNKNSFGINEIFDLDAQYQKDVDYTWQHDLHCWNLSLTYRAKRSEWRWSLTTLHW